METKEENPKMPELIEDVVWFCPYGNHLRWASTHSWERYLYQLEKYKKETNVFIKHYKMMGVRYE